MWCSSQGAARGAWRALGSLNRGKGVELLDRLCSWLYLHRAYHAHCTALLDRAAPFLRHV